MRRIASMSDPMGGGTKRVSWERIGTSEGARVVRDERANGPRYFGVAGGGSAFQMFAWIRQLPFTCFQTLMYLPRSVTPAP